MPRITGGRKQQPVARAERQSARRSRAAEKTTRPADAFGGGAEGREVTKLDPPPHQMGPLQAKEFLFSLPDGETPMPGAPTLELDGSRVTPSQYLLYNQTVSAVQEVVAKLTYKPNMHVFVSSDGEKPGEGVYVQVGIVGPDNYPVTGKSLPDKIVYGRKWRVEKLLPTSELIQTVMLALKSAEEHEARERLVIGGYTPLSNHLDLPLLTEWLKTNASAPQAPIDGLAAAQAAFDAVHYAGCKVEVLELERRKTGMTLVDVKLVADPAFGRVSDEVDGKMLTLMADGATPSHLVYALMDAVLHDVERHVEENFKYDGFARFSRNVAVKDLADFSAFSRNLRNFDFSPDFKATAGVMNRAIDAERAPDFVPGPANDVAKADLDARPGLLGVKPNGL
ncbi:MAG: hypothetical protein JNK82_20645 [Myxococcaceae bacterium]|nr:hypothetical protein [Myxococcaceae bacterium]